MQPTPDGTAGSCCPSAQAALNEVHGQLEGGQGVGRQMQNVLLLPNSLQHSSLSLCVVTSPHWVMSGRWVCTCSRL